NNDFVVGNSGNNTYNAGAGDDLIQDRAGGNDTYIYNLGDGNDVITDIGGEDTIKFGNGITLNNLGFEDINGDLKIGVFKDNEEVGCIFVLKFFKSDNRKIEHFEFADGTIIDDITPYLAGITIKSDYTIAEDNTNLKNIYMKGKKDISVLGQQYI
ncbi:MAG: calcium-binding protein, partial [bacterium]|nr:calcium-binding protein [bacterium]